MATNNPTDALGVFTGMARGSLLAVGSILFGLLFPVLVIFGGSLDLINWGPGLLFAGLACLLLLDQDRHSLRGGILYTIALILLLGLMFLRARLSPEVSAAANNTALIGLAAAGFLIGRLAGIAKSRALFIGLALVALLNFFCTLMHRFDPEWNLLYPSRSGLAPSGLFPHYSYSAAFCLGTLGLLVFRGCNERGWLRLVMAGGAACALLTIPFSPSRGGNLALALMVASAIALLLSRAYLGKKSILGAWLPAVVAVFLALVFAASFVPLIDRGGGHYGFYHDGVRLGYWTAALQIATQYPWLGGGAGSFAWNVYHALDGLTSDPRMVHNEALQLAAEYGFPALLAISALLLIPVVPSLWRFVNRSDNTLSGFAALGLLAMMFQSNFESIFHHAPGVFVAALILGQISRSLWWIGNPAATQIYRENQGGRHASIHFLTEIRDHVDEHLAGGKDRVPELVALLAQAGEDPWRRGSYRLSYWAKMQDADSLLKAVTNLGIQAREELERLSHEEPAPARADTAADMPRGLGIARNLALAVIALPLLLMGTGLSRALIDAWQPLYLPEQMTVSDRFERLLRVVEKHPGLGIDRDVLSAGWDSLHQYRSQQAREYWASVYQPRIHKAIPSWREDPGAALQLAEVAGWAGDFKSALEFYDHAIALQGNNETLFMANSFKGQYFHELFLSAGAAGDMERQQFFARSAVAAFQQAGEALAGRRLPRAFQFMMQDCQRLLASDT